MHIQSLNSLLIKTPSFIYNNKLCETLEAGLDKDLLVSCDNQKVNGITGLRDWCLAVKRVNKSRRWELKHMRELMESLMNKQRAFGPSWKFNMTSSAILSSSSPCLPHLTDDEC